MTIDRETLITTIKTIEKLRLGNGSELLLLGLGVSYFQAMRLARPGVILRLHLENGMREVPGSLAFMNPLDAPACVSILASDAGIIAQGDPVELVAPAE